MMLFVVLLLALAAGIQAQPNIPTAAERSFLLKRHNALRAKHGAPKLKWDRGMASLAASWASRCVFEHSTYEQRNKTGENLAWWSGYPAKSIFSQSVQAWYDEVSQYSFSDPGAVEFGRVGHFTQLVWKETRKLGCARALCPAPSPFGAQTEWWNVVCRYGPTGNILAGGVPDQWQWFKINVLPPRTSSNKVTSGRKLAEAEADEAYPDGRMMLPPAELRWVGQEGTH